MSSAMNGGPAGSPDNGMHSPCALCKWPTDGEGDVCSECETHVERSGFEGHFNAHEQRVLAKYRPTPKDPSIVTEEQLEELARLDFVIAQCDDDTFDEAVERKTRLLESMRLSRADFK